MFKYSIYLSYIYSIRNENSLHTIIGPGGYALCCATMKTEVLPFYNNLLTIQVVCLISFYSNVAIVTISKCIVSTTVFFIYFANFTFDIVYMSYLV